MTLPEGSRSVPRRIVQIAMSGFESSQWGPDYCIIALADDGTLWARSTCYGGGAGKAWMEHPALPNRIEEATDVPF